MIDFSICVPTYEYKGKGVKYLSDLFDSLEKQTFQNFEIVVSDHSIDDEIYKFCEKSGDKFDIKYLRNEDDRGNQSANINECIKISSGKIIKPLFQDDFLFSEYTLEKILNVFENENAKWIVSGCNHFYNDKTFDRDFYPKWTDDILFGNNLLSSPSTIAFLSDFNQLFDKKLIMLMDCEFYYRLFLKNGLPYIINEILVTNRVHQLQLQFSNNVQKNIGNEINYCLRKHNITNYNLWI